MSQQFKVTEKFRRNWLYRGLKIVWHTKKSTLYQKYAAAGKSVAEEIIPPSGIRFHQPLRIYLIYSTPNLPRLITYSFVT